MKFSLEELRILEIACADRNNVAARDLVNLYAATSAADLVAQVYGSPADIRDELLRKVREAIDEQKRHIRR